MKTERTGQLLWNSFTIIVFWDNRWTETDNRYGETFIDRSVFHQTVHHMQSLFPHLWGSLRARIDLVKVGSRSLHGTSECDQTSKAGALREYSSPKLLPIHHQPKHFVCKWHTTYLSLASTRFWLIFLCDGCAMYSCVYHPCNEQSSTLASWGLLCGWLQNPFRHFFSLLMCSFLLHNFREYLGTSTSNPANCRCVVHAVGASARFVTGKSIGFVQPGYAGSEKIKIAWYFNTRAQIETWCSHSNFMLKLNYRAWIEISWPDWNYIETWFFFSN